MKARIVKDGNFWVGEVYGDWNIFLGLEQIIGWMPVTSKCFTKIGARIELQNWKRENCPEEFEL